MGMESASEDSVEVVSGASAGLSDSDIKKTGNFEDSSLKNLFASVSSDIQRLTVEQLSNAPKMPWECGPLMPVFGCKSDDFSVNLDQSFVGLRDYAKFATRPDHEGSSAAPVWVAKFSAKRRRIVSSAVTADDMRCRALLLMRTMLESAPTLSRLGSQLCELSGSNQVEKLWMVLEDSFANKSTGTMYKRSRSLWAYFCWLRSSGNSMVFALSEELIYSYLTHARGRKAAATHGSSFLQAINFIHATASWISDPTAMISNRVRGVATTMYKGKRPLQQARPLRVRELAWLEEFVLGDYPSYLRLIAGYLLCCAMFVCRFSDIMRAEQWSVSTYGDYTILEAGSQFHKTARGLDKIAVLLPFVALGRLFRDESWAVEWMRLREVELIGKYDVVLPSYSEQTGSWIPRAMLASEGALWLREIGTMKHECSENLSTHGLKATLLSWMAKHGSATHQEMRIAGHHADPGSHAPLTYGRDNVCAIQVKLAVILREVKNGSFDPDVNRAGLIAQRVEALLKDVQLSDLHLEPIVSDPLDKDADYETGLEDAEDIELSADMEQSGGALYIEAEKSDGRLMQHQSSGVLHVLVGDHFACGRLVSDRYIHLDGGVQLQWPVCRNCTAVVGQDFFDAL